MREGFDPSNYIKYDSGYVIDPEKNQGRETLDPKELRSKIHSEIADYVRDAAVAKTRGDLEMLSDNMANFIGIGYWDGVSEDRRQTIEAIIKDIPNMDAKQTQMVYAVVRKLKARNKINPPDFQEAA